MKPLDYILLIVSAFYFITFVTGMIYTPTIYFELYAGKVWKVLGLRFIKSLVVASILVYRIWG